MAEDQTLLAHLTLKLASHPENIAVEALGHILSTSPAAVRTLEDVLQTGGAEVGEIARVKTQASGEAGTRPDLAGFDQYNKERVLIEAKFWAGLTDNQPIAYLERLPENRESALLFVAPAARLNTLWAELGRKVSESPSDIELSPDSNEAEGLRSATAGDKRRLMLISWTALLDRMASRASSARDSHTECDIRQLRGLAEHMDEEDFPPHSTGGFGHWTRPLAEQMDGEDFPPLRPEELSPEFPRRLRNLVKLVDDVIECLKQKRLVERMWKLTNNRMEYGRYLLLSSADAGAGAWIDGRYLLLSSAGAWFGLDHGKWATVRDTPLWLYLCGESDGWVGVRPLSEIRDNLRQPGLQEPPEFIDEGDKLVVPIYLPVGVEENAVRDAVVERIEEIESLINPAD